MGLIYNTYLTSDKIFGCHKCKTHLASHDDIISRVRPPNSNPHTSPLSSSTLTLQPPLFCLDPHFPHPLDSRILLTLSQNFRGQHGKAYLFNKVVNIIHGDANERNMTTGRHIVRDISCRQCKETVGWKYDKAYETSEKYKEGKFILEAELLRQVY